jgi:hypothetical protein
MRYGSGEPAGLTKYWSGKLERSSRPYVVRVGGACGPPPPVAAALASSLRAPSRGDPPLKDQLTGKSDSCGAGREQSRAARITQAIRSGTDQSAHHTSELVLRRGAAGSPDAYSVRAGTPFQGSPTRTTSKRRPTRKSALCDQIRNLPVCTQVRLGWARDDGFGAESRLQLFAREAGFALSNSGAFGARLHRAPKTKLRDTWHMPGILAT